MPFFRILVAALAFPICTSKKINANQIKSRHIFWARKRDVQRWDFIKENKKTRTRPRKWSRKKIVFSFFLGRFLGRVLVVLFSWSLFGRVLVFLFAFLVEFLFSFINSHLRSTCSQSSSQVSVRNRSLGWGSFNLASSVQFCPTIHHQQAIEVRPIFMILNCLYKDKRWYFFSSI